VRGLVGEETGFGTESISEERALGKTDFRSVKNLLREQHGLRAGSETSVHFRERAIDGSSFSLAGHVVLQFDVK
jgi:hypothetical protein